MSTEERFECPLCDWTLTRPYPTAPNVPDELRLRAHLEDHDVEDWVAPIGVLKAEVKNQTKAADHHASENARLRSEMNSEVARQLVYNRELRASHERLRSAAQATAKAKDYYIRTGDIGHVWGAIETLRAASEEQRP